jgi:hypothetical protein
MNSVGSTGANIQDSQGRATTLRVSAGIIFQPLQSSCGQRLEEIWAAARQKRPTNSSEIL